MGAIIIRKLAAHVTAYALASVAVCACTASHARAPSVEIATGMASYYADRFTGKPTASGEAYDPAAFTAAHRTLPFGTRVRVTDAESGRSVVVRINDRGPWGGKRIIDISRAAARELGLIRRGHGAVRLTVSDEDEGPSED